MARYSLTPAAKADVREIVGYIRRRNPAAAKKVRQKFQEAMRRLGEFPGLGHFRADLSDEPLRYRTVYSYLIINRAEQRPIEVIRVVHASRDVRKLLDEG